MVDELAMSEPVSQSQLQVQSFIGERLDVDSQCLKDIDFVVLDKLKVKLEEFDTLKNDKLVLEMNLDQLNHMNGKKNEMVKVRIEKLTKENHDLKQELKTQEDANLGKDEKLNELRHVNNLSLQKIKELEEVNEILKKDKDHSVEILKRRDDENTSLSKELHDLNQDRKRLRSKVMEFENSSEQNLNEILKLKFEKKNFLENLNFYKKNCEFYEVELNKKIEEFKNFKIEKNNLLANVQFELNKLKDENGILKLNYDNLKKNFNSVSKKNDENLISIKNLNDQISFHKQDFLKEMESKDKLIEVLNKSNEERNSRIKDLQSSLDLIRQGNVKESVEYKVEFDKMSKEVLVSRKKIEELENLIDDLTGQSGGHSGAPGSAEGQENLSAIANLSGNLSFNTSGNISGSAKSMTKFYSDFQLLKRQLVKEKRLKENLEKQVQQFVDELNKNVPAITATRERCSLLELELTQFSILLEKTSKEKDSLLKENKKFHKKINEYEFELKTLNQSNLDLARQISFLVIQLNLKSNGDSPLTQQEREFIENAVASHNVAATSDTDNLITQRLVEFSSVVELTEKNQELLKIVRQLGNQLETQESLNNEKMNNLESVAIDEARELILVLQDQISSLESQLSNVSRERDMFRSISRGAGAQNNDTPVKNSGNLFNSTPNTTAIEVSAPEQLSLELEYKNFRNETESTLKILNKQLMELSSEKSELAVQLARATSSSELFEQRYKSIQETLQYSRAETEEIRKRCDMLQDQLSRHDVSSQQLSEELISLKSRVESLQLELGNLKLEKLMWKSIEKRLNEENAALMEEKMRLSQLNGDLQRLENDRNENFQGSTARLNLTIEHLEQELGSVKAKLELNNDELRSLLLRKDADAKAYQEKIDLLRSEVSQGREELIKRQLSVDNLELKVADLLKELSRKETELLVYEGDNLDGEGALKKLKTNLANALTDLNSATEDAEQFKKIAQDAETRLAEVTSSYDEYKKAIEAKLVLLEEENGQLKGQMEAKTASVSQVQTQFDEFQRTKSEEINGLQLEIKSLQSKLASSDDIRADYDRKIEMISKDLAEQSKIAKESASNYEQELQKHAEVSKLSTKLREEVSSLQIRVHELTVTAHDATESLESAKESWNEQKSKLEDQLRGAEARVGDLNLQNRMLLNQLEELAKQRDSLGTKGTAEVSEDGDNLELLQVISFLRHEKEISDLQLEISVQEQKRIQQNLNLAKQELDDLKTELTQLRAKDRHTQELELNYKTLMEKVNQLDLLRESNNTLRQECQSYSAQLKQLQEQLEEKRVKLEPLEFKVVNLTLELDTKNKELANEKAVVEFWKKKNQEILQNYNKIDPDEHEQLKKQVEELKAKGEKCLELENKINEIETGYQNERKKSIREANDRLTKFKGIIDVTKKELNDEKVRNGELVKEIEQLQLKLASSGGENALKELEELKKSLAKSSEESELRVKEISRSRDELEAQLGELRRKVAEAEAQAEAVKTGSATSDSADVQKILQTFQEEKEKLILEKDSELNELKSKLEQQSEQKSEQNAEQSVDITELKKQWDLEHSQEVEAKVKEACDALKAKIREPHEAKINSIVNKRFEKLKLEAELEIKKREEELAKKYSGAVAGSNGGANQELLDEISRLKESIEAECKKAKEEGRTSAFKEGEMRYKMTKRQLDKAKEELARLKGGSAPVPAANTNNPVPSIPMKPSVGNSAANNTSSRIPTHNFREALKKPQMMKPNVEVGSNGGSVADINTTNAATGAPVAAEAAAPATSTPQGVKRNAEESGSTNPESPNDKKPKNA